MRAHASMDFILTEGEIISKGGADCVLKLRFLS